MEQFTYINPNNAQIVFDYKGNYLIESYDGLTSAELEPITIKGYNQQGYKLGNMLFGARYITINFDIAAKSAEELYRKREELVSVLNPLQGEGTLIYSNNYITRAIKCIPSVMPTIEERLGLLIKMTVEFACYNPFWFDLAENAVRMEGFVGGLTYPLKLDGHTKFGIMGTQQTVINRGDVDAPIRAEFINAAEVPRLTHLDSGKYIEINTTIYDNERLIVNTEDGNKYVKIIDAQGSEYSAFEAINMNSTFFKLHKGSNTLKFSSVDSSPEVILYWRNYYLGV